MREDRGPESLVLAVGQGRVVSHGFLLLLIVAAGLYLAVSTRNMVATPALSWPAETSHSLSSDDYLLRPTAPARTPEAVAARPDAVAVQVAQETRPASAPAPADASSQQSQPDPAAQDQAVAAQEASAPAVEQRGPVQYEVAPGDTVSTIAEQFGISTETVLWANNISNADFVKIGQSLLILPTDGVAYTVANGDTLLSIALKYGVDTESILGYPANSVSDPDSLSIGQELIIPGGKVPAARAAASSSSRGGTRAADAAPAAPAPAAVAPPTGHFAWPVPGMISQYFGPSHDAIDIATAFGTPIVAADGGVVVDEQKLSWGLGWYITIDHGNGYSTTYGHMSVFAVGPGERVSKGEMIGRIGMTGLTTGPHVHFIVRRNGVPVNPLGVLP